MLNSQRPSWHAVWTAGQRHLESPPLAGAVLFDVWYLASRRWAGVGIGVAVGLKLTPAVFILYFLLTRRYRAAMTAVGTFLATVLLSLVVVPRDTIRYWGGVFLDADRVAIPQMRFNQSLHGLIVRLLHTADVTVVWLATVLVVAGTGLALAVWAHRRGEDRLGVLVTAGVGLLISPVSWEHHWVWLVPLTIYLVVRAVRGGTALWRALLVVLVAALAWRPYSSLVPANPMQALHISAPLTLLFASWLPVIAVLCGAALAGWLAVRRRPDLAPAPA